MLTAKAMTRNSAGIGRGEELAALADELTKLANRLCNTIPRDDWRLIVRVAAVLRARQPQQPKD